MPMLEEHADALGRVYATSLFGLAEAQGGQARIEDVAAELQQVLEVARQDRAFAEFLTSQILPVADRARSLDTIFRGRVSDLTLRFLQVLNQKGRLGRLGTVVSALDELVQERFGRVEVDVFTVQPLERQQLQSIGERLHKVLGKEPVVHPYVDPGMLGGLKLRIGDQLIDASVQTRLRRIRQRLETEGAAEVRAKVDRLFDEGV